MSKELDCTEISGAHGNIGLITLQRPEALNALNHRMILELHTYLNACASNPSIKAIIIRAAHGRAFCAGGDVRMAYQKKLADDPSIVDFFRDEYKLNTQIFHFQKPYIALLDGLTLGGGAGISLHGSHRVATENMSFAMPETGIGFFPDIGASYFLSRLPHKIGFYLGLTGTRIPYSDCLALGLVNTVIASDAQTTLIEALAASPLPDNAAITTIINRYSLTVPPPRLLRHHTEIAHCFSKNSIEEIMRELTANGSKWCLETIKILQKKSPTSLKVTLRELQQGEQFDFDACMRMENQLLLHFLQSHDFFEGIRAAIIDKDHNPRWEPSRLTDITNKMMNAFFPHEHSV
jgi:enoyl-CoA hydratase/carnithine racemase